MNSHLLSAPVLALAILATPDSQAWGTDTDTDGIPEWWETLRGTSDADPADAVIDFDGDGFTSLEEYVTRGRPWGNYELLRFPFDALPVGVPASSVTATEIIAANRSGEYLINCETSAATHSFLWNPPGGPVAGPVLTEIPVVLGGGAFFNDAGQVFLITGADCGEIRNLRQWGDTPVSVEWDDEAFESPAGLANDGRVLIESTSSDSIEFPFGGSGLGTLENFQWRGTTGSSDTLSFGYDSTNEAQQVYATVDAAFGAYFLGYVQLLSSGARLTLAGQFASAGAPAALPALPAGLTGVQLNAAAGGYAAGEGWDVSAGAGYAVVHNPSGWQVVSGGASGGVPYDPGAAAGAAPCEMTGISDSGLALGWNLTVSPAVPFLWNDYAVELSKARPESAEEIIPIGLTASGCVYRIDYGVASGNPQPVVFRPLTDVPGDGAADEPSVPTTDTDMDGILDERESAIGASSSLQDSDGDGMADLAELLLGRNATAGELPPSPGATGLQVYSPGKHPLKRSVTGLP